MNRARVNLGVCGLVVLMAVASMASTACTYMKMNPPPDVDKAFLPNNNTCYLATASNLLAGAGYGTGVTVQARADDVYADMVAQYGTLPGGWTDTALSWWLTSTHNTWTSNPYTVVNVHGNKVPNPWANPNGAQTIGNHLRACNFLGLSISWPAIDDDDAGGHAFTAWGDNLGRNEKIPINPTEVRTTDSDRDNGGDVQVYEYDTYTSPNPGGLDKGDGWYLNYSNNHPYIKHIIVLSPTETAAGKRMAQTVVGSYKIHQDKETPATDLHYTVGTDTGILSYWTDIDWEVDVNPEIEEAEPRWSLEVDWDLTEKPVPYCTWVTITTEFVLPAWNAVQYRDVYFTYPDGLDNLDIAWVGWDVRTPEIDNPTAIADVTGGYVIGAFDIVDPNQPSESQLVGEYRFIHQYGFNQSPDQHVLSLTGESGFIATNLRLGHSYGVLSTEQLWDVEEWMTAEPIAKYELGDQPVEIEIDWSGRLPYPKGEMVPEWMRKPGGGVIGKIK